MDSLACLRGFGAERCTNNLCAILPFLIAPHGTLQDGTPACNRRTCRKVKPHRTASRVWNAMLFVVDTDCPRQKNDVRNITSISAWTDLPYHLQPHHSCLGFCQKLALRLTLMAERTDEPSKALKKWQYASSTPRNRPSEAVFTSNS